MKTKRLLTYASSFLLLSALSTTALLPASAASASTQVSIQLSFNSEGLTTVSQEAVMKNGVSYLPVYMITNNAGLQLTWDKSGQRAQFTGFDKSFAIRVGSSSGMLDGKPVDLGGSPFKKNNELYLPVKFVAKALGGGTVSWDPNKKLLQAGQLHSFKGQSATFEGTVYSVSYNTGDLYASSGGKKVKLANLGSGLDIVHFKFDKTPKGLIVVRVSNYYGEPHLFSDECTLLLKNGSVIRQSNLSLNNTAGKSALWTDGKLLLNDGKSLRMIEDGTGNVLETIDLPGLMGSSDNQELSYAVEALDSDIALIRSTQSGILTLVDRRTGSQTELYKTFYGDDAQKIEGTTDTMFPGDRLTFTGRSGNKLNFTYSYNNETIKYNYTLADPK
ncbi:copper amine oxidase N-terminal domain-containing protein [Paenibacillus chibensis]|uniref:copper amine oxidase N-terminal domain-containing protein n=1 Tax=Paenibacillus chibensis TaxID=59846 RepID=UPI001FEB0F5F|nr:copper amine oxidase N-terminal domain-containing protein [Paenibacillus chibensis]MEC0368961.1 copper amine oxidase N-terminal domain-containing protein [Paenibacillus chibensis]